MSKVHWLGLSTLPGIGGATLQKLIGQFGSVTAVYNAADADLLAVPRVTPEVVARLRRLNLERLEREIRQLAADGITLLTWDDADYPDCLRSISSAPPILYTRGQFQPQDEQAVALVGTREPTPTAVAHTETLAYELARRGVTIVSGLALGIDTAAHVGALKAGNGRTLAVIGSGLHAVHPKQNIPLTKQIADYGVIASEYPPLTRVKGSQLMARDRIISGLSLAVIVIQANENSGSLDTAQKALAQNRLLFAVPGSPGTDALIRQGVAALDLQQIEYDALVNRILRKPPQLPKQMTLF
jgi:DNA processing protein